MAVSSLCLLLLAGTCSALVVRSPTQLRTLCTLRSGNGRACTVRAAQEPQWEPGQDAKSWLQAGGDAGSATAEVLLALFAACKEVSASIATASCDSFACFNELAGQEESIAVDVLSEQVMMDRLSETGRVAVASSMAGRPVAKAGAGGGAVDSPQV